MTLRATSRAKFLDWILDGVTHGVITEGKAKKLYEDRFKREPKLTKLEFVSMLFDEGKSRGETA